MSRTLSQIYSEALLTRNNHLQITELDNGLTRSKLSLMNLLTYVMSALIYTYETVLDVFEYNIAQLILNRINGSAAWYALMATKFQYDTVTGQADPFGFNDETMALEYDTIDESHRIIAKAAYRTNDVDNTLTLMVCKNNTNEEEGGGAVLYVPLNDDELTSFRKYIDAIKFVGSSIICKSLPGDTIIVRATERAAIYYDSTDITKEQAMTNIKNALNEYAKNFAFNGYIYYQSIIDTILGAEYITDVDSNVTVEVLRYGESEPVMLTNKMQAASGYIKFVDDEGNATVNSANIYLSDK